MRRDGLKALAAFEFAAEQLRRKGYGYSRQNGETPKHRRTCVVVSAVKEP